MQVWTSVFDPQEIQRSNFHKFSLGTGRTALHVHTLLTPFLLPGDSFCRIFAGHADKEKIKKRTEVVSWTQTHHSNNNTIQSVENSEGDKKSLNVINITQHTATVQC